MILFYELTIVDKTFLCVFPKLEAKLYNYIMLTIFYFVEYDNIM
jgi:hypothetical protein